MGAHGGPMGSVMGPLGFSGLHRAPMGPMGFSGYCTVWKIIDLIISFLAEIGSHRTNYAVNTTRTKVATEVAKVEK